MDIKVGEYVRDNVGYILYIDNDFILENIKRFIKGTAIAKHSKNLINLIEAGDIVNGRLVLQVDYKKQNVCLLIPLTDTKANTNIMWYGYEDIRTILTHEQYNQNCFKVKGE